MKNLSITSENTGRITSYDYHSKGATTEPVGNGVRGESLLKSSWT